jgi:hypothetical protein
MLCPLTEASLVSSYCTGEAALAQLTDGIQTDILIGNAAPTSSRPLDNLHNLFAASLMVFNPVTSALGATPMPNGIQSGLPHENYVKGSVARPAAFVAPQRWTALAYAAVMGSLLVLMWCYIAWAIESRPKRTRPFPILQFLMLKWGGGTVGTDLKEHFENNRDYENWHPLGEASRFKLRLENDDMIAESIATESTPKA